MESNGQDTYQDYIVYVLLFMLCIFFYVYYIQPKLDQFWFWSVLYEAKFISWYASGDLEERANDVIAWASSNTADSITPKAKAVIEAKLLQSSWHRWVIYVSVALTAIPIYLKRSAYSGMPDINSLLKTEHKVWPTLEFVKRFNPIIGFKELSGVGRYTMSPAVFAAEKKIIPNMASTAGGSKYDRIFDEARAKEVFTEQLGGRFKSYATLPTFHKVLITLTVAKDLPFHFHGYDDLLRMFAIEMGAVEDGESVIKFLDRLCMPLMKSLDGAVYYGGGNLVAEKNILVNRYIVKANDLDASERVEFLRRNGIKKKWFKYAILSNHKLMYSSTYGKAISISKVRYPVMRDLILGLQKQHIDDKSNKTIIRETTFELFQGFLGKRAYASTLVLDACRTAKRNGKFPPGRLVFFRPWDRALFNLISGALKYDKREDRAIVTKSNVCEINGAMAHYYIEELAGRKMIDPQVETAVQGLKNILIKQNVIIEKDKN